MTNNVKREQLRDYRAIRGAREVKFGNNERASIKGYGVITNGLFTVKRVAYVEG